MPIRYDIPIQQSTKYVHKFKYTSSTDGDKGTTHILQYPAEAALLSAYLLSLVVLPAEEDAGAVLLQILRQYLMGILFLLKTWHIKKY